MDVDRRDVNGVGWRVQLIRPALSRRRTDENQPARRRGRCGTVKRLSMKRALYFIPLAVFLVMVIYFAFGLTRDARVIPSVLINQPVPALALAPIKGSPAGFSTADLKNQVTLVNIFGSWCVACKVEHPFLMELRKSNVVPIYGINWREANRDDGPDGLSGLVILTRGSVMIRKAWRPLPSALRARRKHLLSIIKESSDTSTPDR